MEASACLLGMPSLKTQLPKKKEDKPISGRKPNYTLKGQRHISRNSRLLHWRNGPHGEGLEDDTMCRENLGAPAEFPDECSHRGDPSQYDIEQEHNLVNPRIMKHNKLSFLATKFSGGFSCSNSTKNKCKIWGQGGLKHGEYT